jgi:hypothetical protein
MPLSLPEVNLVEAAPDGISKQKISFYEVKIVTMIAVEPWPREL